MGGRVAGDIGSANRRADFGGERRRKKRGRREEGRRETCILGWNSKRRNAVEIRLGNAVARSEAVPISVGAILRIDPNNGRDIR